ncbi:MAG: peptidoglycan-binding protein LysM [Myxococcales bacterium]|nr:peptidoglycan-binding protein LysM [Myxococcales bacterium]
MGLFSFVKSAGRKIGLFGGRKAAEAEEAIAAAKEAAAAASAHDAVAADIRAAILSYVDVQSLAVTFDGETVALSGTASSQVDAEKAVLVAGNTEGVAQVDDNIEVVVPEPPSLHHTVVKGDSLSEIAGTYYGVIRLFDVIFEANQPMLEHPDEIYPGQVLRIPPVKPPVHTVSSGETLGTISKHWYGEAKHYKAIYEANTSILSSPDVIEVGQQLTIPLMDPKLPPLA